MGFACCLTLLLLLKLGLVLTISLILCTPSVLSFTGMSEKVWKKESSLKLVKIWLLSRRITKKLVLTPTTLKEVTMKENIKLSSKNLSKKTRKDYWLILSHMNNPFNIPQLAIFKI